jgi:cytochrome bd-type quinol oxidase subunit 1
MQQEKGLGDKVYKVTITLQNTHRPALDNGSSYPPLGFPSFWSFRIMVGVCSLLKNVLFVLLGEVVAQVTRQYIIDFGQIHVIINRLPKICYNKQPNRPQR